ncbi:hypothetical protein [Nocardia sp. R6R-6]|uniref:hypothetical protein n=1 Tax=Nocardia sp. R6R-6 TaxID=3459303 RepID=UPI00403E1AA7
MSDQLTIGGWMIVGDHCSVRLAPLRRNNYLAFVFESSGTEFELALAPAILQRMVDLGAAPSAQGCSVPSRGGGASVGSGDGWPG